MPITEHPLHGSRRAELPHRALASGHDGQVSTTCCPPYLGEPTLQVLPELCPEPVVLAQVALGQSPSLHPLRGRSRSCSAVVRGLRRYYGTVRLPTSVHLRFPLSGSLLRAQASSAWVRRGLSRFPHEVLERMHRVSDRAGSRRHSRYRAVECCLRTSSTVSAPGSGSCLSRLNAGPAPPPVNASNWRLLANPHDSGLSWFATPSTQMTFTFNTSPV
jgi:hypothetical protein